MPNSFLPAAEQGGKSTLEGVILLGDSWNMRHPLTGGGMTVALNDVVILTQLLGEIQDLSNWNHVSDALHHWHWKRKPLASTINILSVALYDLFRADGKQSFDHVPANLLKFTQRLLSSFQDEELVVLRTGCFKYFERGGECIIGPVSLLSG
jgi:squalene monooxygenase